MGLTDQQPKWSQVAERGFALELRPNEGHWEARVMAKGTIVAEAEGDVPILAIHKAVGEAVFSLGQVFYEATWYVRRFAFEDAEVK